MNGGQGLRREIMELETESSKLQVKQAVPVLKKEVDHEGGMVTWAHAGSYTHPRLTENDQAYVN